jgi:isopenicillin N synthase-like dioxygenase
LSVQSDIAPPAASAAGEEIPIIDIGPLLAGDAAALDDVAAQIHKACTEIGFFFIVNHGMDNGIVARAFDASRQFFALPSEEKMKVRMNRHQCGYMPPDVAVHADTFEKRSTAYNSQPSEAFKFTFDLAPGDPDFGKNRRFRGHNKWPDPTAAPGMHEAFMAFHCAFQALGVKLLPPLSVSLDMAPDFFDPFFERASSMSRIAYYPPIDVEANRVTLPGHKDISFLSLIPPATRPGLEIFTQSEKWIEQPVIPEAILVNTGNTLVHWINDAYIATPHRVRAAPDEARYSNIFFLYPDVDAVLECLPTCQGPDNPAKYPPISFSEFHAGYAARNFAYAEDWD